jgi:hypothetical protein
VAHGLDEQLADGIGAEEKHRAKGRVHEDDAAVPIHDDDALVHRLQYLLLKVSLAAKIHEAPCEVAHRAIERLSENGKLVAHGSVSPHRNDVIASLIRCAAARSSRTTSATRLAADAQRPRASAIATPAAAQAVRLADPDSAPAPIDIRTAPTSAAPMASEAMTSLARIPNI